MKKGKNKKKYKIKRIAGIGKNIKIKSCKQVKGISKKVKQSYKDIDI